MKILEILRQGSLTTIQDLGRTGYGQYGIPQAGAMDPLAFQIGNILVGNSRTAPALEMTIYGAKIRFLIKTATAITGGQGIYTLNGCRIENWKAFLVEPGDILDIGVITEGCRAYLAVAGGIQVPTVLGSSATYIPASLGGIDGRALQKGDELIGYEWQEKYIPRALSRHWVPQYFDNYTLHVIPGLDQEAFTGEALEVFYSATYEVTTQSDRMGFRLRGEPIQSSQVANRVSDAMVRGAIQVPPNGQPMIIGADQTIGGYPIIGVVASIDFSFLAQLNVGHKVKFKVISLEEAEILRSKTENFLRGLALAADLSRINCNVKI